MQADHSRWLRHTASVYRFCARLTPRRFRAQFGADASRDFDRLVEDTLNNRGLRAAIFTAAAGCMDVLRTGLVERMGARHALFSGMSTDAKQSLRICRREPVLAVAMTLTLAIVAGPVVAIYGVLYQVVMAPLPYPNADDLVIVAHGSDYGPNTYSTAASVAAYRDVESFSMVGGAFPIGTRMKIRDQLEPVTIYQTTAGLLSGLGVPFVAGHDLRRGEADVVLTRALARERFGTESAAIGQPLLVLERPSTVVGVIAYRPPLPGPTGIDVFGPHTAADGPDPGRGGRNTFVIARIKPGRDRQVAFEQATAIAAGVKAQFPSSPDVNPELISLRQAISGSVRTPLLALTTAATLVFLLAVSSLGSLVLVRSAARSSDLAVRASLGASRWQLTRSWLMDGLVLAVPGLAIGIWVGAELVAYGRPALPPRFLPAPDEQTLAPTLVAAAGLMLLTIAVFALAPIAAGVLRSACLSLQQTGNRIAGLRRLRLQSALIAGQVALSLVLISCAAWLTTSLSRTISRPVGFNRDGLVTVWLQTARTPAEEFEVTRAAFDRVRQRIGERGSVAVTSTLPGLGGGSFVPLRIRADGPPLPLDERPRIVVATVSSNYFQVLGIPFLEGRPFNDADQASPNTAVIIARSFAARWFPEGALGQVVSFSRTDRREVVGVVEDVHAGNLTGESYPQAYVPLARPSPGGTPRILVIRTTIGADDMRSDIQALAKDMEPTATATVQSATRLIASPLRSQTTTSRLIVGLALVALLLAVVNVYALSAFAVVQRTREIGIRMALGAGSTDAVRLIMRRGLTWVVAGLLIGGAGTLLVAAPLLESQLFNTRTNDPRLLTLSLVVVSAVALVASWLPARRAAHIDPAITLRAE